MNYKKVLVDSGKRMIREGLTVCTWGNISARDPQTNLVYLTPSAMDYDMITEEDIAVCDISGKIIDGLRRPTVESTLHLSIYEKRPDINAVVHTHPVYSTVFGVLREDIPACLDEAAQAIGDKIPVAAYALPGTTELAQNCTQALADKYNACLLANHGAVCVGADMEAAFKVARVLEITAQVYYMARCIGKPSLLKKEDIEYMYNFARNRYGQNLSAPIDS